MGRQILYHCATNPLVLKLTKNSVSFTYKMYPQHNWFLSTPQYLTCQSSLYQFSCFSLCHLHVQFRSHTILFKYKWEYMPLPLCTFLNHSENACLIICGLITQSLKFMFYFIYEIKFILFIFIKLLLLKHLFSYMKQLYNCFMHINVASP